ncbi:MAG: 3-oxoacyl-ACP reductase FabG, partial [Salinisphaera sp.]|nr:3-oxoacyl-ACP reductase FabG [Salinisphaera sp.]
MPQREVALVTGASRGIGAAIARGLGSRGALVIGTATSEAGAQAIRATLADLGIRGDGRVLDVADPTQPRSLVKAITNEFGAPAILVNNAAVTRDNLIMRMSDDEWDTVIDINLAGVYRCSKAVLRGMLKARGGRIINISSVVGAMGNSGQSNYAAAKAGLLGLTRSLAREVASRGITVNAVAPGFIDTDMTQALPEATREALLAQVPLGRLGQAEDVAATVCFLASAAAGYITGETLHVNGG